MNNCGYDNCLQTKKHYHNHNNGSVVFLQDHEQYCKECKIITTLHNKYTINNTIVTQYMKHCCACKDNFIIKVKTEYSITFHYDCCIDHNGDSSITYENFEHCCECKGTYPIDNKNIRPNILCRAETYEYLCSFCGSCRCLNLDNSL
jgi:hypothetical protein